MTHRGAWRLVRDRCAPRQPLRKMGLIVFGPLRVPDRYGQIQLENHILACQALYGITFAARTGYR